MVSSALIALVATWEGFSSTSYQDIAGVWTIGYGHTEGVTVNQFITETTAAKLLEKELEEYYLQVLQVGLDCGYHWNNNQLDAMTSFTYNVGVNNLHLITQDCKRTEEEIGDAILLYNKAGGKYVKGLANRRLAEQQLYNKE